MRKLVLFLTLLAGLSACKETGHPGEINDYPIQPVEFSAVKFKDAFWEPRIKTNQETTIPIALKHCYTTGRVDNFKKAGGLMPGYFGTDFPFDDSDVFKIMEGMAYSINMLPNKELEEQMDTLIYYIAKAQEPDGYLFTARNVASPGDLHEWVSENRWEKTPELSHELYNMGHLYEAAVAHYYATGKRDLLEIAIKNADLLVNDFGPGKLAYEPGHQEVEIGLVKLYRATGKREYLDLAKFFLDIRGEGQSGEYSQTHKPVIEQDEAVGHAVRAAYMYSGMADVAALTGSQAYLNAIDAIWNNVVTKKLYVTGGIGATGSGEAFGANYDLPNMSAYCETCAAIANVFWNHRLFLLHGDARYYDVLERTLYNGVLSGINLEGDRFFYPNPLESTGQHVRSEWFGCACCPSNICRFMPSIPGYVYAQKEDDLYVNLFVQSDAYIEKGGIPVHLSQKTGYPWDGNVSITMNPEQPVKMNLLIRIPGWTRNKPVPSDLYAYLNPVEEKVTISVNGKPVKYKTNGKGYAVISRKWEKEDLIEIDMPMEIHRTIAHENVEGNRDKTAIERGPIVYCLEWVDNDERVLNSVLSDDAEIAYQFEEKLNGITVLYIDGESARRDENDEVIVDKKRLTAIPYYAWANRGSGEMAVWIPRTVGSTRPQPPVTISTKATVSASLANRSLGAVNDGFWPEHSNDRSIPFYSLWPETNSTEWVEYTFDQPETISTARVYWYDDGPWGGCRIPLSWGVQYRDQSGRWREVAYEEKPEPVKDALNQVKFQPVTTRGVRLCFEMPEKESVAMYEFEVK